MKNVSLATVHNAHADSRCFVIGNGPSINKVDMEILSKEVTIGSNGIFHKKDFRPSYYCIEDRMLISQFSSTIDGWEPKIAKLVPKCEANNFHNKDKLLPINFVWAEYIDNEPKFSMDLTDICYWGSSVMYMMLQLSYYIGSKEIYILGMDGVKPNTNKHFYDKKYYENTPKYSMSVPALEKANRVLKEEGILIKNATPNSVITIFDTIDIKEILS